MKIALISDMHSNIYAFKAVLKELERESPDLTVFLGDLVYNGLYPRECLLNDQKGKGRKFIVTDWRCANLLSSKFWPSIGFRPTAHRLVRRIDPVILDD